MKIILLFLIISISFFISINGKSMERHIPSDNYYISYKIPQNTARGAHRSPINISFLPLTWASNSFIHFEWITNIPSVYTYVTDEFGAVVRQETYVAISDSQSMMDISDLDEGQYTIHVCIDWQEYVGQFIKVNEATY